jgi:signal transduction histidine kinase
LINDIVDVVIEKVKPIAVKKQIKIIAKTGKEIISGDRKSIEELLVILLDNAIKYSPEKTEIDILTKVKDAKVIIEVKDQGIGIDEKDLPFIFDRFYRTDKSRTKQNVVGYGLGLSIAKRIVALHNGTIDVKSKVGKGSVFTIKFPIAKS